MNYKELNAPDLVKQWRKVVNVHVMMGRDAALLKDALVRYTSVQIMLGFYQYEHNATISIPQFIRQNEQWLCVDELEADIELAVLVARKKPEAYYVWQDYKDEDSAYAFGQAVAARQDLKQWADRVLE